MRDSARAVQIRARLHRLGPSTRAQLRTSLLFGTATIAPASTTANARPDLGESGRIRSSKATPPARIAMFIAGESASISESTQT
jgi:hypothetical protein